MKELKIIDDREPEVGETVVFSGKIESKDRNIHGNVFYNVFMSARDISVSVLGSDILGVIPRQFKVGDNVISPDKAGNERATIKAIHGNMAWVLFRPNVMGAYTLSELRLWKEES